MAKKNEPQAKVKFLVAHSYIDNTVYAASGKIELKNATQAQLEELYSIGHPAVMKL